MEQLRPTPCDNVVNMPIDPRIRGGVPTVRTPSTSPTSTPAPTVKPATTTTTTPSAPTGYQATSGFEGPRNATIRRTGVPDDSVGRSTKGGVVDDGVGRSSRGGVVDDGVGRSTKGGVVDDGVGRSAKGGVIDDGVGRKKTGGVADDGVGRKKTGGVADDGVGRTRGVPDDGVGDLASASYEAVRDSLVGRNDTADSLALRDAIYERLETPSFLKPGADVAGQVYNFAKSTLKLSKTQTEQLGTLLKGSTKEVATLVGAVFEKVPKALTDVDGKGQTLLSNLARLASQPLHPNAAADTTKQELLASVLRDIANPNRIDQGDAPTCTVTSMQYDLVSDEPAEYARLVADLTGPEGKAKMRGGSFLELQPGDAGARDGRSVSQAIFQTAGMEYGNGRSMEFDPYAGRSVNGQTGATQRGLKPAQQTQLLRQLFGVNYESKQFYTEAEGAKALEKLRTYDARGNQNRPIVLHLDQGDINHAVTLEKVSDQRVFFRDPYGVLRSMPEDYFAKFVVSINAPRDLNVV
jgi:hypothetical protein